MAKRRAQRLRRKLKAAKCEASNKRTDETKNDGAESNDAGEEDNELGGTKAGSSKGKKSEFEGPRLMHHRQSRPQEQRLERFRISPIEGPRFILFPQLPVEIQVIIWQFAMQAEAKRTVIVFDHRSGGLVPTAHLVSRILLVNKLANKVADEFYNLKLEVFKCSRRTPRLISKYGHAMGLIRLNLDYTSLILYFDPIWVNMHCTNGAVQYEAPLGKWHGLAPPDPGRKLELKYKLYHGSRTRLTVRLTRAQCAQVKRIYELEEAPDGHRRREPPCCYGCVWGSIHNVHPAEPYLVDASYDRARFPNVWLGRLLITRPGYNQGHLMDDYAELGPDDLWDVLMPKFVTCDKPHVRRLGDDFEVDPIQEYAPGYWSGRGYDEPDYKLSY
ncbi:hypothetical protein LQW54_009442 [Pestalotiopsis sp. IQ-011]